MASSVLEHDHLPVETRRTAKCRSIQEREERAAAKRCIEWWIGYKDVRRTGIEYHQFCNRRVCNLIRGCGALVDLFLQGVVDFTRLSYEQPTVRPSYPQQGGG